MASYPEPSESAVEPGTVPQPTTPSHHHQQLQDYNGLPSPVPATTVAHHGLQVLQAASAAPPAPDPADLAQQYAQSATLQMDNASFSPPLVTPTAPAPMPVTPASQKVTRLRRACDMCSQRKVKCDESGPPCKPCSDLQVECTFNREMKRRGPPNKHAELARAAKRARNEDVSPAPHHAAETLVSIATHNAPVGLDAEAIAPWPILELLVDDFFTYIHPLTPFPHQPSFRAALASRMDRSSGEFLALLASMVGVLVASFPRSARSHLKAQHSTGLFPSAITMIDHCRSIALEARGARFMMKEEMSPDDAATSYFLGLACAHTLQWRMCKRFLTETITFCRELATRRPRAISAIEASMPNSAITLNALNASSNKIIDHIKDQMGKRIFWVMVAGVRSMTQIGVSINEIPLPPPTSQEPYPEQPVEVDDEYIFSEQILPQPEDTISLITGFNRNIRIYMTMNELVGVDMCYGINFFDWTAQKNILSNGLASAKQSAEDLPPELQVKTDNLQQLQNHTMGFDDWDLEYYPPAFPTTQPANDLRRVLAEQPVRRRHLQFEIQKANIQLSQLATRSYFVERYLNLRNARRADPNFAEREKTEEKDDRDEMMEHERELIVQNLVTVLTSISQRNMEPNGCSLINKIRQVASTLLDIDAEGKGLAVAKAQEYLAGFLDILMKLEKMGASPRAETMTSQDEEEELRNWSSLKEYQHRFMSSGGFLGDGY
ncbi:hypothetical protein F5Y11DRAFT_333895 [Daldinia sp. FL1419]|nr:hypothetical protein F5Y11DRAFT_333895 [Daldinia sp. FL1419]